MNPPAGDDELAQLEAMAGESYNDLALIYSRWNGGTLFNESGHDEYLVEFYPIGRMESEHAGIVSWMESADEFGWTPEEIAEVLDVVVFGQPPASADQLVVRPTGDSAHKILQFDHETLCLEERSQSMEAFLRQLSTDPAKASYDLGCVARYHGNLQAIPYFYSADITKVKSAPPVPDWLR